MTSKKFVGFGLVALAVVVLAIFILQKKTASQLDSPVVVPEEVSNPTLTNSEKKPTDSFPASVANASPISTNAIVEKILKLQEIATHDDLKSFHTIVTELTNSVSEIRKAALDATVQFGSRDAIPILKELGAKTDDAREKVEILDAIEFLELPSFSEIKQAPRTNSNSIAPK